MPLQRLSLARAACVVAAAGIISVSAAAGGVEATNAVARATTPRQGVGIAFVDLKPSRAATLVGADSPMCESVALHEMKRDGVVLSMSPVTSIALPAGTTTRLKAGAQHLMLVHLKQQLVAGTRVPIRLHFQDAGGAAFSTDVVADVVGAPHEADDH